MALEEDERERREEGKRAREQAEGVRLQVAWERWQQIVADHTYFELGAFFYLANDPKVPAATRARFNKFGVRRPPASNPRPPPGC